MEIDNQGNIILQKRSQSESFENRKDISNKKDLKILENNLNEDKKTLFRDKIITSAKKSQTINSEKILELKNKIKEGKYKIDSKNLSNNLIKNSLSEHFNI